jgi:hypothetical protein
MLSNVSTLIISHTSSGTHVFWKMLSWQAFLILSVGTPYCRKMDWLSVVSWLYAPLPTPSRHCFLPAQVQEHGV